ncbi:MAG TPA: thioesterase family protein [Alphaproteobacteria bacterium]|nr:thioesterase family protein [Alphaproteobacteria bacterium]
MSGWTETTRGVVYPWHCDHLGHMNVQHYVGWFDVGAFHFMSMLGFRSHDMHDIGATLVDAQHTIRYLNEQRVGSLFRIDSAITRIGTKSITGLHRMTNTETGDIAATTEIVMVYFDLKARQSLPLTDELRAKCQQFLVDPDSLD